MVECPKCKELIAEGHEKCPFCFSPISAADILKYNKRIGAEMDSKLQQGYITNRKRFKIGILLSIISAVFLVVPIVLLAVVPEEYIYTYAISLLGYIIVYLAILCLIIFKLKLNVCAHCNQYMFFHKHNFFPGAYNCCPRCGKVLYKS